MLLYGKAAARQSQSGPLAPEPTVNFVPRGPNNSDPDLLGFRVSPGATLTRFQKRKAIFLFHQSLPQIQVKRQYLAEIHFSSGFSRSCRCHHLHPIHPIFPDRPVSRPLSPDFHAFSAMLISSRTNALNSCSVSNATRGLDTKPSTIAESR